MPRLERAGDVVGHTCGKNVERQHIEGLLDLDRNLVDAEQQPRGAQQAEDRLQRVAADPLEHKRQRAQPDEDGARPVPVVRRRHREGAEADARRVDRAQLCEPFLDELERVRAQALVFLEVAHDRAKPQQHCRRPIGGTEQPGVRSR